MIRVKTIRLSSLIYFLIVLALLGTVVFLSWRLISGNPVSFCQSAEQEAQPLDEVEEERAVEPAYQSMLAAGFPAVAAMDGGAAGIFSTLWNIITRGDIRDPKAFINYPMPYLGYAPKLPDNELDEAVEVASGKSGRSGIDRPDEPIDISRADSNEDHAQEVSEDIKIQISQIQVDDHPIEMNGEGPKILIYHSHSRESYKQNPKDPYKEAFAEPFRTDDLTHSVIKVGTTLSHQLSSRGIAVLHDQTNHEKEDYNASYSKSLKTLQKRMDEHDSLNLFIDIHRNAYKKHSSKKPDDEVVIINGQRVAKMMVVIGTGEGVVGGFSSKPNWKENAKLAIKLTNKLNELYPGLAKDVYYRTGRYNQHVSTNAILVEVGSTLTTLEEAERATMYLAEAISQIIE